MKKRVADIVIETLVSYGIVDCFGVVGGGAMYLDNALLNCTEMNKYFNHHEQASAMAAEAYARYSGKMALVCVTSGPGATNTLTGVLGAWQDSLPMIVVSGQVRYEISVRKSGLPLRYRGIQEFDIIPVAEKMTKYATMIVDPLAVKRELVKAINLSMEGRRGPVWVDIPLDIQNARVEERELYPVLDDQVKPDKFLADEIEDLFSILDESKRPCILTGSGIISSHTLQEFRIFIDKIKVPVVGGAWVPDSLYNNHPLYFGSSGNVGPRTGNFILQNADTILVLGNSLGFRQTGFNQAGFSPKAKIYMVDADKNESIKPGLKIEKLIYCDLNTFFKTSEMLGKCVKAKKEWITYCNYLKSRFTPFEGIKNEDDRICCYSFWKMFEKIEPEDSILVLGNNTANTAKLQIGIRTPLQRVINNINCGSMGYDLPAAVGVAIASKKRVCCITGDGSIMMNIQEMQTIVQYNLPIKIIVFSNDGYGAIRQTSKNFFEGKYIGCTPDTGISFPDIKDVASTFHYGYDCCSNIKDLEQKLYEFFDREGNIILEIFQCLDDAIIPKVMSRLDENGAFLTPDLHDMFPFLEKEEITKLMLE